MSSRSGVHAHHLAMGCSLVMKRLCACSSPNLRCILVTLGWGAYLSSKGAPHPLSTKGGVHPHHQTAVHREKTCGQIGAERRQAGVSCIPGLAPVKTYNLQCSTWLTMPSPPLAYPPLPFLPFPAFFPLPNNGSLLAMLRLMTPFLPSSSLPDIGSHHGSPVHALLHRLLHL